MLYAADESSPTVRKAAFFWGVKMEALFQQLPALLGVIIGGAATYLFTVAAERSRWRRDQRARWDSARMQAYAQYGEAVKRVIHITTRMAAAHGIQQAASPIRIEEGIEQLDAAVTNRTTRWETLLLMGDPATIVSARKWHECVWELEYFARGHLADQGEWDLSWSECEQARHEFYRSARMGIGIDGEFPDVTWTPPWRARVVEKFGEKPFLEAANEARKSPPSRKESLVANAEN